LRPTAWDGYVRVDYIPEVGRRPERGRLQVTFATVEATIAADVRPGLRAGFVTDDPDGPPTFIQASVSRGRLADDLSELLGASIAAVAEQVVTGPGRSRWTRLNVGAVDSLSSAWAPYRDLVLAGASPPDDDPDDGLDGPTPRPRAGTADQGLWVLLVPDELRRSMADLPVSGGLALLGSGGGEDRDDNDLDELDESELPPVTVSGQWAVPPELAELAGIEPRLVWEIRAGRVHVVARPAPSTTGQAVGTRPTALVSFDDGANRWQTLIPDADGTLRAVIDSLANPERLPAVRLRVTTADTNAPRPGSGDQPGRSRLHHDDETERHDPA